MDDVRTFVLGAELYGREGALAFARVLGWAAARGAVGFGSVTARDGDYFGPLVNVVARASKVAPPGAVVITAEVARSLDPPRWPTEPSGAAQLRGTSETVHLDRATPTRLERT